MIIFGLSDIPIPPYMKPHKISILKFLIMTEIQREKNNEGPALKLFY